MPKFARSLALQLLVATVCVFPSALAAPIPLRVLVVCGGCCHDYDLQKNILAEGLKARAYIEVETVQQGGTTTDTKMPLYENENWAKGYDLIIHDECFSDVKDNAWTQRILKPHKEGLPAVVIHCAMHCYRDGSDDWFKFLGVTSPYHGASYAHEVLTRDADHPIMQKLGPGWWNPAGELYHIEKVWPTAHALAAAKNQETGKEEVCVWVNQYNEKTRVFGTTLGHHNETVSLPEFLDLVTRGTLWAANKLNDEYLKPAQARQVPVNIAKGKKATASSEQPGHPAKDAFDGTSGTRWCANGPQTNEWLQIDLGSVEKVTGTKLDWESGDAIYKYKIEGSTDASKWQTLFDGSRNSRKGTVEDNFNADGIRFLRVTFLESSSGSWGSINEFQVFGTKTQSADARDRQSEKRAELMAGVKVPEGFEATIFAQPPSVNYPVFVSAAPDGTLYISSDKNGSLDRAPYRGRILRARDTDGDGIADEVKMFVSNVDSPRGLVWDHDRLYLMHPPNLSVYIDKDGDGIADEEKVLVKNIAFGFKDRPADHTSNGLELGIDGWIYCAIGDFGFMEAEGTDGKKLQLRGGGVVRVRPDGTGLELYSHGTRNILEVAVSPLLDAFARDNTNDGDGWDVRFHHFAGGSEHGYPSLFKHFKGEFIEALADYGGGAGCGALFLSEPGFPRGFNNAIYTADWGREWIYRHRITPKGATYDIDQNEFVKVPRPTDLDVDGSSRLYVSSWKNASFTYIGEEVGFIARVTPKNFKAEPLPDFEKTTTAELLKLLESPSHRRAQEAQRTLVRRGVDDATVPALMAMARNDAKPLTARVAAIFALKQSLHEKAAPRLAELAQVASIREYAVRALTDRLEELNGVPAEVITDGIDDPNPRVRREAAYAIARLGQTELAAKLKPLLADSDPVVAHTAVQALKRLHAFSVAFDIADNAGAASPERTNAIYVLESLHETPVVTGLIERVKTEQDVARRRGLLTALCRLYYDYGAWKGDSWGTRPDTTGPYYQPVAWEQTTNIATVLKEVLNAAAPDEGAFLVQEFARHKIQSDDATQAIVKMAASNPELIPTAAEQLAQASQIPTEALSVLTTAASGDFPEAVRANAIVALSKSQSPAAIETILPALSKFPFTGDVANLRRAMQSFLRMKTLDDQHALFENSAAKMNGPVSAIADAALIEISERSSASPEARAAAKQALDTGWSDTKRRTQIIHAVALSQRRDWRAKIIEAANDNDATVSAAAMQTARTLGFAKDIKPKSNAPEPLIETMKPADVVAAVVTLKGDRRVGEQLFTQQGCVNCHTVTADQPLKGPFLGNIATIYKRPELAEAILLPNKTIAQGFTTHQFVLKDGTEIEGFVTQEAAEQVTIRNAAAQEIQIKVADVAKRTKSDRSIMPEGLAANLTVQQFASLIDYLQGLANNTGK